MKHKVLRFLFCGVLFTSCRERLDSKETKELDTSIVNHVRDTISVNATSPEMATPRGRKLWVGPVLEFSNTVRFKDIKASIDTSSVRYRYKATKGIGYSVNRLTHEVVRSYRISENAKGIDFILIGNQFYPWSRSYGFPDEFIGEFLFSSIYRGGGIEGTITKMKFKIAKDKLLFVDSIPGGYYGEGYGTDEWLISDEGEKTVRIFHGGDVWTHDGRKLLITPEGASHTYFIDLPGKDTVSIIPMPGGWVKHQQILKERLLICSASESRIYVLTSYTQKGVPQWSIKTDYLQELLVDETNNKIIGCGYYFPDSTNNTRSFVVAFDLNTGKKLWDIPLNKLWDTSAANIRISTRSCFQLNVSTYDLILSNDAVPDSFRAVLVDTDGYVITSFPVPDEVIDLQHDYGGKPFTIIPVRNNEFDIITKDRTTKFIVTLQPD